MSQGKCRRAIFASALFFCGCESYFKPVSINVSSAANPAAVKKEKVVALMPIFCADNLGVDIPHPGGPTMIVYQGIKKFRCVLPESEVLAALKREGWTGESSAQGESLLKAHNCRSGMTMKEALAAGRDLKADAILIGSFGTVGDSALDDRLVLSLRLLDVRTKKVIWGAARSEKTGVLGGADLGALAGDLFSEAP